MNNRATQPFQSLLSDYINQKIDACSWNRFQAVCDLETIAPTERLAFATYFVDSIDNNEAIYMPKACEAELILDDIRVDNFGLAVGF